MWIIFNSPVLKDIINVFLFYYSFKLTWSATDRRPVASSRKEVPTRSPTSRRSVGNQSPISRRPVADSSATNCKTLLRLLCDLCDRFEFWSRRGRRAVAVYVWLRLNVSVYHTFIKMLAEIFLEARVFKKNMVGCGCFISKKLWPLKWDYEKVSQTDRHMDRHMEICQAKQYQKGVLFSTGNIIYICCNNLNVQHLLTT